uniref:SLC26A/SulP transporter domain-containing protein n=1 Tax=Timema tahoe TaxID=61484 RepID=A0A7R9FFB0_9NEOP|nr:unnamed protein product [Timema tahoe]
MDENVPDNQQRRKSQKMMMMMMFYLNNFYSSITKPIFKQKLNYCKLATLMLHLLFQMGKYSSSVTSLVLTDSSQLRADDFEELPDQIMYPYAEPYDLQKHSPFEEHVLYGFVRASSSSTEETSTGHLSSHVTISAFRLARKMLLWPTKTTTVIATSDCTADPYFFYKHYTRFCGRVVLSQRYFRNRLPMTGRSWFDSGWVYGRDEEGNILEVIYSYLLKKSMGNHLGNTTLNRYNRELNHDNPAISRPVLQESDALDHLATEADQEENRSISESNNSWKSPIKSFFRCEGKAFCSRSYFNRKIPITEWLPKYSRQDAIHDVIAGLTVSLTVIPQGIAIAVLSGLQPQYGLYSAFMGPFVYILFGSCKDITVGPTALLALMTQSLTTRCGTDFVVLLTFLSGCVISMLGILRMGPVGFYCECLRTRSVQAKFVYLLCRISEAHKSVSLMSFPGFLIDFISLPVSSAFTSAAAITIATSQINSLLGIKGNPQDFLSAWELFSRNTHTIRRWDTILGFSSVIVLLLTRQLKSFDSGRDTSIMSSCRRVLSRTVWLTSVARNALVVVAGTAVAYFLTNNYHKVTIIGEVAGGLPSLHLPPFSTTYNGTQYSFVGMANEVGTSLFLVPLISILESIAIAKAFATNKSVDATQEMLALGLSNVLGSFVGSMPVTGSFTRTAVNNASGVRTQMGGIITGVLVLLSLGFLSKAFYYIPKTSLSALILCAMIFMNLKSLTDDLNAKHLPVIFWNWSHDAMTTLLSMDPEMEQYFRSSDNVQGLFQDFGDIVPSRKSTFVLISEG